MPSNLRGLLRRKKTILPVQIPESQFAYILFLVKSLLNLRYPFPTQIKSTDLPLRKTGKKVVSRPKGGRHLLNLDLSANVLQFIANGLGLFLGNAFLNLIRGAVNQVFGFLQTQTGKLADHFDHLDLFVTRRQ